jgi:ASC-1-like (ASCH) protein/ribosomal protein S27AE
VVLFGFGAGTFTDRLKMSNYKTLIMKRFGLFFLIIFLMPTLFAQEVDLTKGLVAHYPLDGKAGDITGKNKAGKVSNVTVTTGHDGKAGGAYRFKMRNDSYILLPVNADPGTLKIATITAWVQPRKAYSASPIIATGGNKDGRALYFDDDDHINYWFMQCGGDGEVQGPAIITQKWIFVAMLYDAKNREARFVIGNEFYKSNASVRSGDKGVGIGQFDGDVDDVRIYDRFLTVAELEKLSGLKINATQEDMVTVDRFAYKEEREKEKAAEVKAGDVYIVNADQLVIRDSAGGYGQKAIVKEGDTLFVDSVMGKNLKVLYNHGDFGFISRSTLLDNAYPEGESSIAHTTKYTIKYLFDFTRLRSWIVVGVLALILFFALIKFVKMDELLNRLRRKDMYASGGSKSGALAEKQTLLHKMFPINKLRWWPLIPGALAGVVLFVALVFSARETEWFFAQGFHLIPAGYFKWVHWMLFGTLWLEIIAFVMIVLESYVVTGPVVMFLRILIILILNVISFVVAFYLAIIVTALTIIWMIIKALGSSGSNYKCPHCGGTFSASSGGSYTCPHCGGGVTT